MATLILFGIWMLLTGWLMNSVIADRKVANDRTPEKPETPELF